MAGGQPYPAKQGRVPSCAYGRWRRGLASHLEPALSAWETDRSGPL